MSRNVSMAVPMNRLTSPFRPLPIATQSWTLKLASLYLVIQEYIRILEYPGAGPEWSGDLRRSDTIKDLQFRQFIRGPFLLLLSSRIMNTGCGDVDILNPIIGANYKATYSFQVTVDISSFYGSHSQYNRSIDTNTFNEQSSTFWMEELDTYKIMPNCTTKALCRRADTDTADRELRIEFIRLTQIVQEAENHHNCNNQ